MLGDERRSIRSPTTSRNGSYGDGPMSRATDRPYEARSSFTEDNERDDNEYEEPSNDLDEQPRNDRPPPPRQDQYIAALRYRFPNRPKTDYAYKQPAITTPVPPPAPIAPPIPPSAATTTTTTSTPATTAAQRSGGYQTISRPPIGGASTTLDIGSDQTFRRPALRRVTPEDQNTYAKRITTESPTPAPGPQTTTPAPRVRINEGNAGVTQGTPSGYPSQPGISRAQESTFEKVPSHGGPVSYLGTGTFSQFEHCLRECLERERRQTGMASHISRQDIPPSTSAHEYGYDLGSSSTSRPVLHSTSSPYLSDYPSRAMGTFTIDDIRHINVALSRSGISLFPYERPFCRDLYPCSPSVPCTYPNERHRSGEVVSACRVVEEDPALLYNKNGR